MLSLFTALSAISLIPVVVGNPIGLLRRQQSLYDCLSLHLVPTFDNSSASYSALQEPYNLRLSYFPTQITLPTTPQQVADSVTCAAAAGVKVQPKGGGHSYASYSSGGQNGSLIVDLQNFKDVVLDNTTNIVAIGAGQRLGNIATEIYNQGQRALPHGTCPGVGIGGHATHGGYGLDSRLWGLTLDTIVGLDVVLANGSIVHASKTEYPEIYFALRGAAESFGIITTFYLETLPAPTDLTYFSISIPDTNKNAAIATKGFLALQEFAQSSPYMTRNLSVGIYHDPWSFSLSGWYFGDKAQLQNKIVPAMVKGFPKAATTSITTETWLQALQTQAGPSPLIEPLSGYDVHDTFYAKSVTTRESKPLTSAALQGFFKYTLGIGKSTSVGWYTIINLYGGRDSQINSVPANASAYNDRDSLWVFQNYGTSGTKPYTEDITVFVDGMNDALTESMPDGEIGAYLNYVDPSLSAAEAGRLYYGKALYDKLSALKKVVDPLGVFWNPQTIGNAVL